MTRVKRGVNAHRRHRKIVKAAKGYRGQRSTTFKQAKNAVMKAGLNAYRDRRLRKRNFRSLWITRINAACRKHGITYSRFMNALLNSDVQIDRKMLAEMAVNNEEAFKALIDQVKEKAKAA
jgi:large subunit ribosomal protein L20